MKGTHILLGSGIAANKDLIRRRLDNVSKRAAGTQPERRITSDRDTYRRRRRASAGDARRPA